MRQPFCVVLVNGMNLCYTLDRMPRGAKGKEENRMKAYERLLKYVVVHTASDDASETVPSSMRQFDLAHQLVEEMTEMGIQGAHVDEKCYVYGYVPATEGYEKAPAIGLIAHMDTVPDFSGLNVKPRLIENYDGNPIVLGESGRILEAGQFPHLPELKGRTLIVTDGTTVLGADDKAGIANIMTAVERIITENIPHGKICVSFTPDEEIGRGADHFDLEAFGADFAYTVDGGKEGEIEYENFNACGVKWTFNGFNVHPGSAKDTMINANLVAIEANSMLPAADIPARTEEYEGFFHLTEMEGNVEKTVLKYIVRDHDMQKFNFRKYTLEHITKVLNEKYGEGTVELEIKDQYMNMSELIKPHFHLIDNAVAVVKSLGIEPVVVPIRGGTDGVQLTFKGLPCPNLGTGGFAFHGPYEHATVEGMDQAVEIILGLLACYAKMEK